MASELELKDEEALRRSKTLNASSATIIFVAFLISGILIGILIEALGSPLDGFFFLITSGLVMVVLAINLIPANLKEVGPNGAAWVPGHWENVLKGWSIGCIIGVGSFFWNVLNRTHLSSHGPQAGDPIFHAVVTPGYQQMLAIAALVLLGPAVEEMMFRGILYGGYRKSLGPAPAAFIVTVIFVALHFPFYFHASYKIIPYIVASLAFLWCRVHWKAIGPAIAAHSGLNMIAVLSTLMLMWQHVFYESGVAEYKASKFNEAIASLTRAIQWGDHSSAVYTFRGNAEYGEGDMDGAISDYTTAIELNPKSSTGFYNRGLAKQRNADFEGAIADYDEAIALNPKDADVYRDRGLASLSERNLDAAMADFDVAIKLNPTNSMSLDNRAWTEFLKGDFSSSVIDATRSIQLNPNLGYPYAIRGWARYRGGDISSAIEDCNRATKLLKPGSGYFFFIQGLLDYIAKDYAKAIADWQNAIGQKPSLKEALLPWIEKAQEAEPITKRRTSNIERQR